MAGKAGTCQQQAPDAKAVLSDHQHREDQQRVQLQVGAVDRLHASMRGVSLGTRSKAGTCCRGHSPDVHLP